MFKHIKKIYSDLTEFFLVLLTGLFAGSIFTLAYIKYWDTSKVTFADIGGMLAGTGTIGLLLFAWRTADDWKKKKIVTIKRKRVNAFYNQSSSVLANLNQLILHKNRSQMQSDTSDANLEKLHKASSKYNQSLKKLDKTIIKLEKEFDIKTACQPFTDKIKKINSEANESNGTCQHNVKKIYALEDEYKKIYQKLYDLIDNY